jgi:hypothetical protein
LRIVLLDKGYVNKKFAEVMRAKGIEYVDIKRDNMIKNEDERLYYHGIGGQNIGNNYRKDLTNSTNSAGIHHGRPLP